MNPFHFFLRFAVVVFLLLPSIANDTLCSASRRKKKNESFRPPYLNYIIVLVVSHTKTLRGDAVPYITLKS